LASKSCIVLADLLQESGRIEWFDCEQRQIYRPAIFHAVALFCVRALRGSFGATLGQLDYSVALALQFDPRKLLSPPRTRREAIRNHASLGWHL
jgi:hypothetical protein